MVKEFKALHPGVGSDPHGPNRVVSMLERRAWYYRHNHRLTLMQVFSIELNASEDGIGVRFSNFKFSVAAQFLCPPVMFQILPTVTTALFLTASRLTRQPFNDRHALSASTQFEKNTVLYLIRRS